MNRTNRNTFYLAILGLALFTLAACSGKSGGSGSGLEQGISISPVGGTAPLRVSTTAKINTVDGLGAVTGYRWDFDGTSVSNASASHTFSTPGEHDVTLTVTTANGDYSWTETVYVYPTLDNTSNGALGSAGLFSDDFEYVVDRTDTPIDETTINNPFVTQGGWGRAKAINISGSFYGYLYTTTTIPGYTGPFPGRNSNRVLAIESRAGSMCTPADPICQTDFYLESPDRGQGTENIPGDVWFQFWIYSNYYNDPDNDANDQLSAYANRSKFIYPCNGSYGCAEGNIKWLFMLGYTTGEPFWANNNANEVFMTTFDSYGSSIDYSGPETQPENHSKLGQTDVGDNIKRHRWTLVKLHFDTSGNTNPQGVYQAWIRPLGDTNFRPVADWQGGVTTNLIWNLAAAGGPGGHRVFRMPTTVDDFDSWIYLDDFVMAATEGALPTYPY